MKIKKIFVLTLCILSFNSKTFAFTETTIKQKSNDKFIRNFVKQTQSNKVNYDGKKLTLYANPTTRSYVVLSLGLAISTLFWLACLSCNDNEVMAIGSVITFILNIIFLIRLGRNLYYSNEDVPFIVINNKEIKIWDEKKIRWKKVFRIKSENIKKIRDGITISNKNIVYLCDKYLNSLLKIEDENYLPISFDNLIALLEHFIQKKAS